MTNEKAKKIRIISRISSFIVGLVIGTTVELYIKREQELANMQLRKSHIDKKIDLFRNTI